MLDINFENALNRNSQYVEISYRKLKRPSFLSLIRSFNGLLQGFDGYELLTAPRAPKTRAELFLSVEMRKLLGMFQTGLEEYLVEHDLRRSDVLNIECVQMFVQGNEKKAYKPALFFVVDIFDEFESSCSDDDSVSSQNPRPTHEIHMCLTRDHVFIMDSMMWTLACELYLQQSNDYSLLYPHTLKDDSIDATMLKRGMDAMFKHHGQAYVEDVASVIHAFIDKPTSNKGHTYYSMDAIIGQYGPFLNDLIKEPGRESGRLGRRDAVVQGSSTHLGLDKGKEEKSLQPTSHPKTILVRQAKARDDEARLVYELSESMSDIFPLSSTSSLSSQSWGAFEVEQTPKTGFKTATLAQFNHINEGMAGMEQLHPRDQQPQDGAEELNQSLGQIVEFGEKQPADKPAVLTGLYNLAQPGHISSRSGSYVRGQQSLKDVGVRPSGGLHSVVQPLEGVGEVSSVVGSGAYVAQSGSMSLSQQASHSMRAEGGSNVPPPSDSALSLQRQAQGVYFQQARQDQASPRMISQEVSSPVGVPAGRLGRYARTNRGCHGCTIL